MAEARKPRKPRKNLTAVEQVERNETLAMDKLRGASWEKLMVKYDLSESQVKRCFKAWRQANAPKLREKDPFEIVWESVERYEQWIEQLADIALDADQDSAKVGAINSQARLQAQRDELLQKSGILPQNLGKLKVEHDIRYIAQAIVKVFDEDDVPLDTRRKVLGLLRPGEGSTN